MALLIRGSKPPESLAPEARVNRAPRQASSAAHMASRRDMAEGIRVSMLQVLRCVAPHLKRWLVGVPKGIRPPVTAGKGRGPRRLDDGESRTASAIVVELGGIEPPTSCMPCKRSPS